VTVRRGPVRRSPAVFRRLGRRAASTRHPRARLRQTSIATGRALQTAIARSNRRSVARRPLTATGAIRSRLLMAIVAILSRARIVRRRAPTRLRRGLTPRPAGVTRRRLVPTPRQAAAAVEAAPVALVAVVEAPAVMGVLSPAAAGNKYFAIKKPVRKMRTRFLHSEQRAPGCFLFLQISFERSAVLFFICPIGPELRSLRTSTSSLQFAPQL